MVFIAPSQDFLTYIFVHWDSQCWDDGGNWGAENTVFLIKFMFSINHKSQMHKSHAKKKSKNFVYGKTKQKVKKR